MKSIVLSLLLSVSSVALAKEYLSSAKLGIAPQEDLIQKQLPYLQSIANSDGKKEIPLLLKEEKVLQAIEKAIKSDNQAFEKADAQFHLRERGFTGPAWSMASFSQGNTGIYLGIEIPSQYNAYGQAEKYSIITITTDDYLEVGEFDVEVSTHSGFDPYGQAI